MFRKYFLISMIGLLSTAMAYAKCGSTGLWVYPGQKTIRQNPVFIIEGQAESQRIISGLNRKYHIYLKNGNRKVKLLVIETHAGQYFLTQALLKPETELEAGQEYTMHIDSLPRHESFGKYKYKVVAAKDIQQPLVGSMPVELTKSFVQLGCGPSIHVVFTNAAKDESAIFVKTTVRSLKTGKATTYYLQPNGDRILVGHGMCSGAFTFNEGDAYEVVFSFMDASCNMTVPSGSIRFTKPLKETGYSEE